MATDKQLNDIASRSVTFGEKRGTTKSWTCKHCSRSYVGGTSRIVSHLLGLGGGIAACTNFNDETERAAVTKLETANLENVICVSTYGLAAGMLQTTSSAATMLPFLRPQMAVITCN